MFLFFVLLMVIFGIKNGNCLQGCPLFHTVYDTLTKNIYVEAQNKDVHTNRAIWDDSIPVMRVPLENFQVSFPECFPKKPLVMSTTNDSSSATVLSMTSSNTEYFLPYARKTPPGVNFCTEELVFTKVNGVSVCSDYGQFVTAEQGSLITPNSPDCIFPNCIRCAVDPTGLGVFATQGNKQQQYCSGGVCATLWTCLPRIGCSTHKECNCGFKCMNSSFHPFSLGPHASEGEKMLLLLSEENEAIFNGTYIYPQKPYGCCNLDVHTSFCEIQQTSCVCIKPYTAGYDIHSAYFIGKDGKRTKQDKLNTEFLKYASEFTEDNMCCSGFNYLKSSTGLTNTPTFIANNYITTGNELRYTIASVCAQTPFLAPVSQGKAVASDKAILPSDRGNIVCFEAFSEPNFGGISAIICNAADGNDGLYGFMGSLIKHDYNDHNYWWNSVKNNTEGWQDKVESYSVPPETTVIFYQDKNYGGSSKTIKGCNCNKIKTSGSCCVNFGISSLKISK